MVGGVLTAHTMMRPAAKGQEAALKFDVFLALFAEAVGVKLFRPRVGLQQGSGYSNSNFGNENSQRPLNLQKFEDEDEVQICMYACNRLLRAHDDFT